MRDQVANRLYCLWARTLPALSNLPPLPVEAEQRAFIVCIQNIYDDLPLTKTHDFTDCYCNRYDELVKMLDDNGKWA